MRAPWSSQVAGGRMEFARAKFGYALSAQRRKRLLLP
jgi:hypothetical protein